MRATSNTCNAVLAQYSYLSLGCSKNAELAMLRYARSLIGKPFSNLGMVRSIVYPRQTDGSSFFCAGAPYRVATS